MLLCYKYDVITSRSPRRPDTTCCLTCAARVLLEWKRTFKVSGKLAALLDTGDRAWREQGLPCDNSWYGIRCELWQGVPRVAVM